MSERSHGFSPYKYAYDGLLAVIAARQSGRAESVSLKQTAKGDVVVDDVTAVAREGESLMATYSRAAEVMRAAVLDFGHGVTAESPFD